MKYIHEELPATGTVRERMSFLMLPVRIDNETRWLEHTCIQEIVTSVMNYDSLDYNYHKEWVITKFISK